MTHKPHANRAQIQRTVACTVLLAAVVGVWGCQSANPGVAARSDPAADAAAVALVTYEESPGPLFAEPTAETAPPASPAEQSQTLPPLASSPAVPRQLRKINALEDIPPEQRAATTIDYVLQQAIANAAVIRDPGQFLSPGNPLLTNPEAIPSALDPDIRAASPQGVQAALAAFDSQLATGVQWGEDALVQTNSFFTGNVPPTNLLVSESGTVYGRLDRATRTGGRLSLVHNWNYTPNSLATGSFNSRYVGFLRTEIREPLLAGRGATYTDIAGPVSITGGQLGHGVRVARLDQQVSLDQFEAQLTRLVKQSQDAYWDFWLAYETYHLLAASRDNGQALLDRVRARQRVGLPGAGAADEAQAEEALLQRESAVNDALAEFLHREVRLRRLIGMPAADNLTLIPAQQPFDGQLWLDWPASVATANDSRVELRRQRVRVEALQLQAWASKSLLRPQLDLVAGAQVNGFGDEVFSGGTGGGAVGSLFGGDNAGWSVGVEFSTSLHRRTARTRQRRLQLELTKARQVLLAQEEEVQHELAHAYREVDRTQRAVEIASRRRAAAQKRLGVAEADAQTGRRSIDLVIRAQAALADAQRRGLQSLVDYNKAIVELKYREGSLLRENQIDIEKSQRVAAAEPRRRFE